MSATSATATAAASTTAATTARPPSPAPDATSARAGPAPGAATGPALPDESVGALHVVPFVHPQGCRGYLLNDPTSGQTLALDAHLDLVDTMAQQVRSRGWTLPYVVDSHTHADHPSGSARLAALFGSTRIAHEASGHAGVTRHVRDGDVLHLGDVPVTVRHAPGHTPDHVVLLAGDALFSGDSLLIGSVARADFLGGDAGALFDSIHRITDGLPDGTVLYPAHDYQDRARSTLGDERAGNPWLRLDDRDAFARALAADPPPRPANMDDLLRLNRQGVQAPDEIPAAEAVERVRRGGATSVVDVRTESEFAAEHVPGSVLVPLDRLAELADAVRAVPAPRLLLCRTGRRAEMARETLAGMGVGGLSVVAGGLDAFTAAGGDVARGEARVISLERQVRIGAGSIVLLGVVLGYLAHPAFFALAGLVGAGLITAGVTDWCGLALLLAKMPWNRSDAASSGGVPGAAGACAATPPGACAAGPPPGTCAASPPPAACSAGAPPPADG